MSRAERRHKPKQDKNYIQQERRWRAHIREMVPKIYAGFALTLARQKGLIDAEKLKKYVKDNNIGVGCNGDHQKEFLNTIEELQRDAYFDFDQLVNILAETQELWQSDGNNGFDILKTCSEETGINLMSKVTANAIGVEGDAEV